jgi:mRNA turnover protein 4
LNRTFKFCANILWRWGGYGESPGHITRRGTQARHTSAGPGRLYDLIYDSEAEELLENIKGQVGLFFTDTSPQEVIEWFNDFKQADFARSGNIATRNVVLPAGPIMRRHSDPPEPFPHNEEPQLRKLGLSTYMNKGLPSLHSPHQVCQEGKPLTSEQTQLLKLIGEKMVEFKVGLVMRYDSATSVVEKMEGAMISDEAMAEEEGDDDGSE